MDSIVVQRRCTLASCTIVPRLHCPSRHVSTGDGIPNTYSQSFRHCVPIIDQCRVRDIALPRIDYSDMVVYQHFVAVFDGSRSTETISVQYGQSMAT